MLLPALGPLLGASSAAAAATPVPTVTLTLSPQTITSGGESTIAWSSTGASACTASGNWSWSGTIPTSGSAVTSMSGASYYLVPYTITCTGAAGSASATANLGVSPAGTTTLPPAASTSSAAADKPAASGASTNGPGTGGMAPGGSGTVPLKAHPLPLLSTGVPIYASSAAYPASDATSGNYNRQWRSNGVPATLTLDLSSVPAAKRRRIWLVWYNDATYGYSHTLRGQVGYNNVGAYSLAANAAPGGTAPPTTGWVVLGSLAGNTLHSYGQEVNFAGYNWIQYTFTASDGSAHNSDIALNLDVYGTSSGVTDGWFFGGDSITANCMAHGNITGQDANNPGGSIVIPAPSFGQQINAMVGGNTPEQENGGVPGFTSGQSLLYFAGWLRNVPSKYVTINLGTNDAAGGVAPAMFYANMEKLARAVIAAGKVPVIPTIPYALDPAHQANAPALNAQIRALYRTYPAIVPGPDLWTYFMNNPRYLSTDSVHPNAQGCAAYRTLWAQFAADTLYR